MAGAARNAPDIASTKLNMNAMKTSTCETPRRDAHLVHARLAGIGHELGDAPSPRPRRSATDRPSSTHSRRRRSTSRRVSAMTRWPDATAADGSRRLRAATVGRRNDSVASRRRRSARAPGTGPRASAGPARRRAPDHPPRPRPRPRRASAPARWAAAADRPGSTVTGAKRPSSRERVGAAPTPTGAATARPAASRSAPAAIDAPAVDDDHVVAHALHLAQQVRVEDRPPRHARAPPG